MIRLGVNIDHVATLRQARRAFEPDPVAAAVLALLGGADGVTIHLREDRRHIQDRDLRVLRQTVTQRLNLELAAVQEILNIALEVRPDEATLVPERREEVTTEGGLDVITHQKAVGHAVKELAGAGIEVSLFVDPDPLQIEKAKLLGARAVEIQTARYSEARMREDRERELAALEQASSTARDQGPWPQLRQRGARLSHPGHRRIEHWSQHRFPRRPCGHGARGSRDEGCDHGS